MTEDGHSSDGWFGGYARPPGPDVDVGLFRPGRVMFDASSLAILIEQLLGKRFCAHLSVFDEGQKR